ncbi:MAG: hypothetical protein Q7U63_14285 [Polaromonas sp.]|uniref:hypothetical protein n=1 Tax=Polaromonas sp. TaxID=1869339 RepID=UPI0027241234|nr:hypothetical protein [Polaromonas sp.]MDO9114948.1 hypothetical protein [Polaromonas sp.]
MIEEILTEAQELCRAIEQLPASAQQSAALLLAFGLAQRLSLLPPEVTEGHERRASAFQAIAGERTYQDAKHGTVVSNPHEVGTWLMLISVHLRRAQDALASADHPGGALDALRKVLAIGTACGEQHGLPARRALVNPRTEQTAHSVAPGSQPLSASLCDGTKG